MRPNKSLLLSSTVIPVMVVTAGLLTSCGAGGAAKPGSTAGVSQTAANPCAAKNSCAARNPCNPCNPCAEKSAASSKCVVPRLQSAAANPCAAKNPCNPCAAKNPFNPCAAGGGGVKLTAAEARTVYDCLKGGLQAGYSKSGNRYAAAFGSWKAYNNRPFTSGSHGGRLVNSYANAKAASYGRFEKAGRMRQGGVLTKDSFSVNAKGQAGPGPLFLMEKMRAGFNNASGDWRYTLVMPNGQVVGVTNGRGSARVKFCYQCHMSVAEDQDSMMLMPDEVRAN